MRGIDKTLLKSHVCHHQCCISIWDMEKKKRSLALVAALWNHDFYSMQGSRCFLPETFHVISSLSCSFHETKAKFKSSFFCFKISRFFCRVSREMVLLTLSKYAWSGVGDNCCEWPVASVDAFFTLFVVSLTAQLWMPWSAGSGFGCNWTKDLSSWGSWHWLLLRVFASLFFTFDFDSVNKSASPSQTRFLRPYLGTTKMTRWQSYVDTNALEWVPLAASRSVCVQISYRFEKPVKWILTRLDILSQSMIFASPHKFAASYVDDIINSRRDFR